MGILIPFELHGQTLDMAPDWLLLLPLGPLRVLSTCADVGGGTGVLATC